MLFLRPMYPRWLNIRCCRCSFWNQCICNLLFFELADTFNPACHVNCIYILPFLKLEDASFANFASTSHVFYNVRMFLIEILHLQPTLSKPCRYSLSKLRIFNPLKSTIADIAAHYSLSPIYSMGSSCEVNSNKGCQYLSIKALLFCSFDLR